jgi:hypothetical protein
MKINATLKCLLDYLNDIESKIMIEHFDRETGTIKLSNNNEFNIDDLQEARDIEAYL